MTEVGNQKSSSILVIDDNDANLQLLTKILSSKGYRIRAVQTGHEGLNSVQSKLPDLILLDIKLPDMLVYGTQACDCIGDDNNYSSVTQPAEAGLTFFIYLYSVPRVTL